MSSMTMNNGMTFDSKLSLCIPRVVSEWANKDLITNKFQSLNIGTIKRVDFVEKSSANGIKYYMAFLHFEQWEDNQATRNIQNKIMNEETSARLVYDEPWYWILLKNNNPISDEEAALQERVTHLEQQVANLNYWNMYLYNQINWIYYYMQHEQQLRQLASQQMEDVFEQEDETEQADENENNDSDDNSSIPSLVSITSSDFTMETPEDQNTRTNTPPSGPQNSLRRRFGRIINRADVVRNLEHDFNDVDSIS
tara:strand:+ start:762 stop:1520 length:759 start_codon:yes stop_codon:yes gene_type:complete